MSVRTISEVIQDAEKQGLRRALVVTALPIEMKAVRAHLTDLGSCPGRDGNVYECGQFSGQGEEWLVVVAESGAGTHAAHSVVTYAHIEFGGFELTLFTGIGASRKSDVPIGSVVASSYLYFPYSGKYGSSGFTSRPHSLPIDPRLIGLARKVQRDEDWSSRIVAPLKAALPDSSLYPKPYPPAAIVAPIVTVEAVSGNDDSELERQINQHYSDSHALEMEGYGAVYAASLERTPIMVIRGISDLRTGKSAELDVIYQPVAAAHAAAFTFELLDLWGLVYRIGPKSPSSAVQLEDLPTTSSTADDAVGTTLHQDKRTLVLNFDGSPEDFPPEKVAEILAAIRKISGNPSIEVVGSEAGSFRLFVAASKDDLATIDTEKTRQYLAQAHGVRLLGVADELQFRSDQVALDQLRRASDPLLNWPQRLPDGTWIDRPELRQLLEAIENGETNTTAVLGAPGSGKSALLGALGQELSKRGVTLLAIKADFLNPSIANEDDLRHDLALDERPSDLLGRVAGYRKVVLLIDQLDALAAYVDLKTGRLSVLVNLVRKLAGMRNMHIVLSARSFEYEHDVRLKAVRAESLALELPAWSMVLPLLEAQEIQAAGWPTDAQELLRSPQALSTFLKLRGRASTPPFRTYQAMLDEMWRERVIQRPDGGRLAGLAYRIADMMAERETLWLARAKFDDHAADIDALVAGGILTPFGTGETIGFTHQTLFEHALARAFTQEEGRLSSFVIERMSSLFVRPKLWAALTYLRSVDTTIYEAELDAIWSAPNLSLHLRHLMIEFLGQQSIPSDFEAVRMEWAFKTTDQAVALRAIAGSPGWFERFASSYISREMTEANTSGLAAIVLAQAWKFASDRVARLIRDHWLPDIANDGLVWSVLQDAPTWTDEVLSIAISVLKRTAIAPFAFDYTISTIGSEQPMMAILLVRAALDRQFCAAMEEAERRSSLPIPIDEDSMFAYRVESSPSEPIKNLLEGVDGWESLEALAKSEPLGFVEHIWPWFKGVFEALRAYEHDGRLLPGFAVPYAGDFRFEGEHALGLSDPTLLGALRAATEALAENDQPHFLAWLAANESENATPAQRLFAHALACEPERYATRALAFLTTDARRLHLGNIEDGGSTTKRLVRNVSPYWTTEQISVFEKAVLEYRPVPTEQPDAKTKRRFRHLVDQIRLGLLTSLPEDRIAPDIQRLVREDRRRFPRDQTGVTFQGPTYIGSPMSSEAMGRASDDEILNAFRTIPDASGWNHPNRWMSGGNIQLSREFANFAKEDSIRAASLIRRFEAPVGARASAYALDTMAESAEPDLIFALIRWLVANDFDGEEFRGSIARAVERLVRRDVEVDSDIVAIFEDWLTRPIMRRDALQEGQDEAEAVEQEPSLSDKATQNRPLEESILWGQGGLQILPSGNYPILETLARVFLAKAEHDRLLSLLASHLERPEDETVWRSLIRLLVYMRPASSKDLGQFFGRLFQRYPTLKYTPEAAYLLAHAHWRVPEFVRVVLDDWQNSKLPATQQAYGEVVGLIAIVHPTLEWAGEMLACITSSDDQSQARVGLTYAAVNLWGTSKNRSACSEILRSLLPRRDRSIWIATFDLFRVIDEITPEGDWISLLEVIAENIQAIDGLPSAYVVDRLQTLLPHEALLVARLTRGLVSGWRNELGDVRTGTSAVAPELVDLAITLHRLGPLTRNEGTALFEDLLEINAYSAQETLDQIDNRFREGRRFVGRRLPRRSAKRKRNTSI